MLKLKQVYLTPRETDGVRILVDRLWPRGLTRQKARIDRWIRSVAPSNSLSKWLHENPRRWAEFKKRYREELDTPSKKRVLEEIKGLARAKRVTLLFASKNGTRNNAVALLDILKEL